MIGLERSRQGTAIPQIPLKGQAGQRRTDELCLRHTLLHLPPCAHHDWGTF